MIKLKKEESVKYNINEAKFLESKEPNKKYNNLQTQGFPRLSLHGFHFASRDRFNKVTGSQKYLPIKGLFKPDQYF